MHPDKHKLNIIFEYFALVEISGMVVVIRSQNDCFLITFSCQLILSSLKFPLGGKGENALLSFHL